MNDKPKTRIFFRDSLKAWASRLILVVTAFFFLVSAALFESGSAQGYPYNLGMFWKSVTGSAPISQTGQVISVGGDFSCALLSDGTARCWGGNMYGKLGNGSTTPSYTPVTVSGLSGAVAISAGMYHGCAILSDGTARCWGSNSDGLLGNGGGGNSSTPVTVSGLSGAVGISAGNFYYNCAVLSDGTARCWGNNQMGQLGNGTSTPSSIPVTVSGLTGAVAVSADYTHSCALLSDGTARCWGSNNNGQLGNGSTTQSLTPVTVSGLSGAVAISTGGAHSCAVLSDGTARCWGNNQYGNLGNGNTTNSSTPVTVSGLSGAVAISVDDYQNCALLSNGTVRCWGYNVSGQLGNGGISLSYTPVTVSGLSGAVAVSIGDGHSCALLSDGSLRCWGSNVSGQLGNGIAATSNILTPVAVSGLSVAEGVSAGGGGTSAHSCVVLSDGTARCWGANGFGQLGNGSTTLSSTPVMVSGLSNAFEISTGSSYSCALLSDGTARCWGVNTYGELGNGSTIDSSTPVTVSGLVDAVALFAGGLHSCALLRDGSARCWGDNNNGQLGNGNSTDSTTPVTVSGLSGAVAIDVGGYHNCTLLSDGTARCWGSNNNGQLGNGITTDSTTPVTVSGLSGAVAISAGTFHSCAVLSDGTARCWGDNAYGQLGNGSATDSSTPVTVSGLSGAIAISTGMRHSCALLSNGNARCWGYNAYGELGNGSATSSYTPVTVSGLIRTAVAISAGDYHSCALSSDGSVRCWGSNNAGQVGQTPLRFYTGDTQVYGFDRDSSSPLSGITATTPVSADGIASSTLSVQLTQSSGSAWSGVTPTFSAIDTLGRNVAGTCSVSDASGASTCSLKSTYAEVKELWLTTPIRALVNPISGVSFTAGSASKLVLSGQDSLSVGTCSSHPYQLTLTDGEGNAVAAGANFTATLSGLGSASVYSDPQCAQALGTTLGFVTGSSAWNFYLKDSTEETLSLAAAASGLTSASLGVTVAYVPSSALSSITGSSPVTADGVSTSTVTITLKNTGNAPIAGVVPTFSATDTGSTNTYGACSASDASGISTCTLSSTRAETKTLSLLTPVAKTGDNVLFAAGAATKLAFTVQPSGSAFASTAFSTQPVVQVQDALGNTVTAASDSITLSAFTDSACTTTPAPGTVGATTNPLSATSGVSTFSGVSYSQSGAIYLKASATGLTSPCSSLITVTNPPVLDQSISANNAGGAATYTIPLTTSGTNRLVLLAVSWKNTTAMGTVPSGGPGGWTSVGVISQGTAHRTEVFRAFAASQYTASNITITVPSSAKSSAVMISFRNTDTSGTNGSGAIDAVTTTSNTTANPSLSITPVSSTQDTIVLGFLGNGNATAPTAGTGYTLQATGSATGNGPTTRTTTSVETRDTLGVSGVATTVDFGLSAIDWTQINVVIKGP